MLKNARRFSSAALKVWVGPVNADRPIKVGLAESADVADLTKAIKRELPRHYSAFEVNELTLHTSMDGPTLPLDLSIDELLKTLKVGNSPSMPLIVKPPIVKTRIPIPKVIYMREIDENGKPTDTFSKLLLKTDSDVKDLYAGFGRASGLTKVDDPTTRLTELHELEENVQYQVGSPYGNTLINVKRWQANEASAMEHEVFVSLKDKLAVELGVHVVEYPRLVTDEFQNVTQEWDGVLFAKDTNTLYLMEAKHSMTVDHLANLAKKLLNFPLKIQKSLQPDYQKAFGNIVGVAAGTHFPAHVRQVAHDKGLKVYHVSGRRYMEIDGIKKAVPDFVKDF